MPLYLQFRRYAHADFLTLKIRTVVVLEESPCPQRLSMTNLQVLVLVLKARTTSLVLVYTFPFPQDLSHCPCL